ncbi:MAG: zinc ribbon domain-containing protein [candidate division WOR-3 bacterium]
MGIIFCRECQKELSKESRICPYCGASLPKLEWKRQGFEWKTDKTLFGYPLIHIAFGRDTQNKIRVAKGIIAIGQFAIGLITFAQFGIGILFGLGQFILSTTAIAQFAISILLGIGQLSIGYISIGQFSLGFYVLAQNGFGKYIWSPQMKTKEAIIFFTQLYGRLRELFLKSF